MPEHAAHTAPSPPVGPTLHCPRCRHDLAGLPGTEGLGKWADLGGVLICPECGTRTTLVAALDAPGGDRGWGYFVLWVVSAVMVLVLGGCLLTVLGAIIWSAAGPGP